MMIMTRIMAAASARPGRAALTEAQSVSGRSGPGPAAGAAGSLSECRRLILIVTSSRRGLGQPGVAGSRPGLTVLSQVHVTARVSFESSHKSRSCY